MSDLELIESHLAFFLDEVRSDASRLSEFEEQRGSQLRFSEYYASYMREARKADRTLRASALRRLPVVGFVDSLKVRFGPNPLVLEVGCGYGTDTFLLSKLGCRVVAVEPNPDFFAAARQRLAHWHSYLGDAPTPEFVCGQIEDLTDIEPASFHGAFTAECLHHCEPVENALLAIRQAVADDSIVLVLESNGGNPAVVRQRERVAVTPNRRIFGMETNGTYYIQGDENIRNAREWRLLFHDCGFETVDVRYARHLITELTGSRAAETLLCSWPGANLATIHVTFTLETRAPDQVDP